MSHTINYTVYMADTIQKVLLFKKKNLYSNYHDFSTMQITVRTDAYMQLLYNMFTFEIKPKFLSVTQ